MPEDQRPVCQYDKCRQPFERKREHGQYCSPRCRKLAWLAAKAKKDLKPLLLTLLRDDPEIRELVREISAL